MQCWNSTVNPSQSNRAQLLYQCFQLIKALQQQFTNGEIAVPSTDPDPKNSGMEICILYPCETMLFGDIADFLTSTAESMGFAYRKFVKQDVGLTRFFSVTELENISHLDRQVPDELHEEAIRRHLDQIAQFNGFHTNESWRNSIIPEQRCAPLIIPRTTLRRLHTLEGNDLTAVISSIMQGIEAASHKIKTGIAIIEMIATGVAGIYQYYGSVVAGVQTIWDIYIGWNAGVAFAALATGGPLVVLAATLTSESSHAGYFVISTLTKHCPLGGLYLMLKDAVNVLIVVNDTPNDVLPLKEWIEHGDRRIVPELIPAAHPNSDFVYGGLFFYSKFQIQTYSVGLYGSSFGVSFETGDKHFSVGMSCPNSLLGGRNSAQVHNREDAHAACEMARNAACAHGWCVGPYIDVRIASSWGNVNWARAVVMKD